jgi:hypothetical protein
LSRRRSPHRRTPGSAFVVVPSVALLPLAVVVPRHRAARRRRVPPVAVVVSPVQVVLPRCSAARRRRRAPSSCRLSTCCPLSSSCQPSKLSCRLSPCCPLPVSCRVAVRPVAVVCRPSPLLSWLRHGGIFLWGGGGGVWAKKVVTLCGLRISEKKEILRSRQYCKCILIESKLCHTILQYYHTIL